MPLKLKDFGGAALMDAVSRISTKKDAITRTMSLIANGRAGLAETSERIDQYKDRFEKLIEEDTLTDMEKADIEKLGLERMINRTNDILSTEFLEAGTIAAKSIGRVDVLGGLEFGTGFLVGNHLLMTNFHVLENPANAAGSEFVLNLESDNIGPRKEVFTFSLDPDLFFLNNEDHDFALVAVVDPLGDNPDLDTFGWHVLMDIQGKIRVGDSTNIIQHPDGGDKSVVVHNSHFLHVENETDSDRFCWYSGHTEEGSSGSPVFNHRWEVVGVHHRAIPKTNKNDEVVDKNGRAMSVKRAKENPEEIAWLANEGIRASRLVQAIASAHIVDASHKKIRDDLIDLWKKPGAQKIGQRAADSDR